ncbi:MAG: transposase [Nitrosomonas sp.]|nr:transposase [Nitrosomonas sp.]
MVQREYDREIYKERNLVERLFQAKQFRRIATRYERLNKLSSHAIFG